MDQSKVLARLALERVQRHNQDAAESRAASLVRSIMGLLEQKREIDAALVQLRAELRALSTPEAPSVAEILGE